MARVHEWAWGDVGRRTVCGLVRELYRATIVADLGCIELAQRCKNCDRMRAAIGASSKPVISTEPAPIPDVALPECTAGVSDREREILEHATGWLSRWPLFRNHFCASEGDENWSTIQGLIARGLMRKSREPSELSGGDSVFSVTAVGVASLKRRKETSQPPTSEAAKQAE